MPLLAAMFSNLFVGFSTFLAGYIGARAALAITAIATIAAMTAVLAAALSALVAGIFLAIPTLDPAVESVMWMALPSNLPACAAAILATDGFCAVYRWGHTNVQLAMRF